MEKENLMDAFPYERGDTLPNGIKISVVCKGDNNDTFGGYLCKEVIKIVDDIPVYGNEVICQTLEVAATRALHDHPLEVLGPVAFGYPDIIGKDGYPKGAKIWFKVPGEKNDRSCTPAEFLDIAKDSENAKKTKKSSSDEKTGATCQATTKAGNPCKGKVVNGGTLCMAHAE